MNYYNKEESNGDIAVSTRITLSRNLKDLPFPEKMTDSQRSELLMRVKSSLENGNTPFSSLLRFFDASELPENEVSALAERDTVSRDFAEAKSKRAVILSEDESISITVVEKDHLKIQVTLGGLQLEKAYDIAERLDTLFYENLGFAFDGELGFLTASPADLGTGLRASVVLHLPIIQASGSIRQLISSVSKIGFAVCGTEDDGTRTVAGLYRISNRVTLGISEKIAIENLKAVVLRLSERERNERNKIKGIQLEDMCFRALGTLCGCRILGNDEMKSLLSTIKIGKEMGIINMSIDPLKLIIGGQHHMLIKKYGQIKPDEENIYRAAFVSEAVKGGIS